jgi:hypothetical protein
MIKVGQRVTIPWWEYDLGGSEPPKKVPNLTGTIESINGAYHYVKIEGNPKYDVLELYPNEFEVIE